MAAALLASYDGLVCDLDGVVYRGPDPVPHAVESLDNARTQGVPTIYATNNASRPPAAVAAHLRELGLTLTDDEVINSSVAGAEYLRTQLTDGATVLAVGGVGVAEALRHNGFEPLTPAQTIEGGRPKLAAVLQGYGPEVTATDLAEAAYAIQSGARWVATNSDLTLPTAVGTAPGNGSLVAAVRNAVTVDPEVVGKPGPLMYRLAADRLGTTPARTLGIGDRLETDVAGASAAGMSCLHVLTGVHGPRDLVAATADLRPRYVAEDLRALHEPYDEPQRDRGGYAVGSLHARLTGSGDTARVEFEGEGGRIERLRVALRVLWDAIDAGQVTAEDACGLV
ncbi:HAD-IIA family hydrolase [Calidifontibacter sp. DB0510]|uniref:HAD-IIA family hydrolase n=1 Tax=Metallococcus carri TaxID=1656884 RepID=A0A967B097_9MICO|nr:HAD-IIA family hydrolase [Metallococcus carri]NHN55055.1 HAD-IIA family hydrolase [Metallococcus carri]NOP37401.1 HAD-IIA family hydrolase [Calidifontibacter sp. DB2511S]